MARLNGLSTPQRQPATDHLANTTSASHESVRRLKPLMNGWQWPVKDVQITSKFGPRGKDFHEGIDLRAKVGTPIYAVEAGKVLYAGQKISGYGRMIVLKHRSGLATIYAHNSRLLVKVGQRVRKGQRIAISGQTGHVSGPHLHFEIREGVAAIDPMRLLPRSSKAQVVSENSVPPPKRFRPGRKLKTIARK